VVQDTNRNTVENASVIFHELDSREKGNMELKTNEDGKAVIDVLAIGATVRFQVIAKGYQTYGQDFKIEKPNLNLLVKLSRPVQQYSIYTDHSKDKPQAAPELQSPEQNGGQPETAPAGTQNQSSGSPQADQPSGAPRAMQPSSSPQANQPSGAQPATPGDAPGQTVPQSAQQPQQPK
jgi:hypothetical protein